MSDVIPYANCLREVLHRLRQETIRLGLPDDQAAALLEAATHGITNAVPAKRPPKLSDNGFPRRARLDLLHPGETAVVNAIDAVEDMGAHELLTNAVVKLGEVRDLLADWIEYERDKPETTAESDYVGKPVTPQHDLDAKGVTYYSIVQYVNSSQERMNIGAVLFSRGDHGYDCGVLRVPELRRIHAIGDNDQTKVDVESVRITVADLVNLSVEDWKKAADEWAGSVQLTPFRASLLNLTDASEMCRKQFLSPTTPRGHGETAEQLLEEEHLSVTIARDFHDAYEAEAPKVGWDTQERCRKEWSELPAENRAVMIATVADLLKNGVIRPGKAARSRPFGQVPLKCDRCDEARALAQRRHNAEDEHELFDLLTAVHKAVHPENFSGSALY